MRQGSRYVTTFPSDQTREALLAALEGANCQLRDSSSGGGRIKACRGHPAGGVVGLYLTVRDAGAGMTVIEVGACWFS